MRLFAVSFFANIDDFIDFVCSHRPEHPGKANDHLRIYSTTNKTTMSSTLTSDYVEAGGVRAHYLKQGDSGEALLLLHGVACSVLDFQQNLDFLSKSYRVFALDLMGHGETEKPLEESYSIAHQAQFVLDFMSAVGLDHAHFLGWSLGGRLTLQCAAMDPQRVSSMVLVAPGGVDDRSGVILDLRLSTIPLLGELMAAWPSKHLLRHVWSKVFFDSAPFVTDEIIEKKWELARQSGANQAFLKCLRSLLGIHGFLAGPVEDIQAKMPKMATPALVIWGLEDKFVSCSHHKVLAAKLPTVQVELFDNCGHAPHIECADLFHAKVSKFLKHL